ncbi:MAG: hypothetical protein AAF961_13560 [Planctomycetota bacterium]
MLSHERVELILQMLKEGQSQRSIASRLKVGRNQVSDIARGRRPDYQALRERQQGASPKVGQSTRVERCPSCGARVRLPCVYCHVKRRAADRQRLESEDGHERFQGAS